MAKRIPMGILDKLAKIGKDDFRAETWAELEPGMKFFYFSMLIPPFCFITFIIFDTFFT
jgi:hypothetical protein|tara:strand:+ start:188 stop:364 length:177 start_codon:yes stop_codon:yes gene_type:complete